MAIRPQASGVAHSFTVAAADYDRWAQPQWLGAQRLASLLNPTNSVRSILDIGCGTGRLLRLLHERFPQASLSGVDVAPGMIDVCRQQCAAIADLSLTISDVEVFDSSARFDLLVSSFCLQWLRQRETTIARLARLLQPKGIFAVVVPVAGSLVELAESYRAAIGSEMPGLDFASADAYLQAVKKAGFTVEYSHTESLSTRIGPGIETLRYFQATGALFRHQPGYRPRSVPEIRRLIGHYETTYADAVGNVPVTYQTLYLVCSRL